MRERSHLGALIEERKRLDRLSDAQVVARAKALGHDLGKSNLGRIANGAGVSLTRRTICALAAGLGTTPEIVARAVLADMGIVLPQISVDCEAAIRTDPSLSESARRVLLAAVREVRQPV
ncbi:MULTISPECIES: hypothetical protein [unclassified Nocardia]|uniref:hypothetical protein n=1 Tax=unclassified Nocardia TaxID=2637762 RepID=UPI001CE460FF|nr:MULTISPECIES: hypothetical protein [unclassified Nocardia]